MATRRATRLPGVESREEVDPPFRFSAGEGLLRDAFEPEEAFGVGEDGQVAHGRRQLAGVVARHEEALVGEDAEPRAPRRGDEGRLPRSGRTAYDDGSSRPDDGPRVKGRETAVAEENRRGRFEEGARGERGSRVEEPSGDLGVHAGRPRSMRAARTFATEAT